jgi:hypothetical protein
MDADTGLARMSPFVVLFSVRNHFALLCPAAAVKYKTMRKKLLKFLKESSHYDISQLLICAQNTNLHEERVILNSKNGSHSKALHILIYEYKVSSSKMIHF